MFTLNTDKIQLLRPPRLFISITTAQYMEYQSQQHSSAIALPLFVAASFEERELTVRVPVDQIGVENLPLRIAVARTKSHSSCFGCNHIWAQCVT
jgi:hypothetical protein